MAITVGTNSWVTIIEADEYLTNKIGSQAWYLLDDVPSEPGAESKESYLINSYNYLLSNSGYSLTPTTTDDNVKKAQIEFAYYLFVNGAAFAERAEIIASGVSEFKASKWSEKYRDTLNGEVNLPIIVQNYLKEYVLYNTTVGATLE